MHIPDGFLNSRTELSAAALSAAGLAVALRRTRDLPRRQVPLMGLAAAFVFAAQMLNFPIGGGTSGHLVGGVLCSVLLGPSAAILVITCVLLVQCFVFADGGILALGANIFNMAIVCSVGGYLIYSMIYRLLPTARGRLLAVAVASWASTVVAAVVCAGQLSLSHMVPWSVALPAMAGVHMFIGVGEALITTLVIFTIMRARPELLEPSADIQDSRNNLEPDGAALSAPPSTLLPRGRPMFDLIAFGLLVALGLAVFVSPFASTAPDGLDHVADALGFREHESSHRMIASPIPDYQFPGIHSAAAATALAGGIGTLFVFGAGWMLARVLIPANSTRQGVAAHASLAEGAGDA